MRVRNLMLISGLMVTLLAACESVDAPGEDVSERATTTIAEVDGRQSVVMDSGEVYPLDNDRFRSALGAVLVSDDQVQIRGWAADMGEQTGASEILLFSDGELVARVTPHESRRAITEHLGMDLSAPPAFRMYLPREQAEALSHPVSFYALTDAGVLAAGEMHYPERARCMLERLPDDPAACEP